MRQRLTIATAIALGMVVAMTGWSPVRAQTTPPANASASASPLPSFEVASVKINRSGDGFIRIGGPPGGRFTMTNVPLREMMRIAYGLQPFQITGGPSWMDSERYDVVAQPPAGTPPAAPFGSNEPGPMQLMLQSLLAERFHLKAHRENRDMPIYALVLARSDGKLGPKLEPATVDCAALRGRGRPGGAGGPAALPPPPEPGKPPQCGMMMGIANIAGGGMPIAQLANGLSTRLGRIVSDRTGLKGDYQFTVEFTPDQMPQGPGGPPGGGPPLVNGAPVDMNGPSIFTALQEQLGLKLESTRGPVDVLVIDSIEHPTED
jgi:uncharacterized protein (TIGR03435 family)